MKRGQVTIFIILGILIIAAIAITYFTQSTRDISITKSLKQRQSVDPQIQAIDDFMQTCTNNIGLNSLFFLGQQSGYFRLPEESDFGVAFYFYNRNNLMPELQQVETGISRYIESNIQNCIENFEQFPEFNIQQGLAKVKATIGEKNVVINIDYPLQIERSGRSFQIEEFNAILPIRLGTIYSAVSQITKDQLEDPNQLCISCMGKIAEGNNLKINILPVENNTLIFTVEDHESLLYEAPYQFVFGNKYQ